jgi:hypothetical protein
MDLLRYYLETGELKVTTDKDIEGFLADQTKKSQLAEFIYFRHYYRYIKPFEFVSEKMIKVKDTGKSNDEYSLIYKNGFSIMANCCLLIETLESFYRGWEDTKRESEKAFLKFFSRDKNFKEFAINDIPSQFYFNIRCGILHQGETRRGWIITRSGNSILDFSKKKIDATLFLKQLKKSLNDYKNELNIADWNDDIWCNARKKIKAILKNNKS